jgi:hypothetical protein
LPQRISVQEESFPDAGDEEPWFDALPQLEPAARGVLLKVLAYVAISDGALSTPERRFFRRLSKQLDTPIDIKAIEALAARLHAADDVSEASAPLAIAPALA